MQASALVEGQMVSVTKEGSCLRKGSRAKVREVFNDGVVRLTVDDTATCHVHADYLSARDFPNAAECEAAGVHRASESDVDGTCDFCFCS